MWGKNESFECNILVCLPWDRFDSSTITPGLGSSDLETTNTLEFGSESLGSGRLLLLEIFYNHRKKVYISLISDMFMIKIGLKIR